MSVPWKLHWQLTPVGRFAHTFPCKNFTKSLNTATPDWVQNGGIPFYELLVCRCQQVNKLLPRCRLSWQANIGMASTLWYLKAHYHVQKSPQIVPVLKQMNLVHTLLLYFFKAHFNIILPAMLRFFKQSLQVFRPKFHTHISSIPYVLHAQAISSSMGWDYYTNI